MNNNWSTQVPTLALMTLISFSAAQADGGHLLAQAGSKPVLKFSSADYMYYSAIDAVARNNFAEARSSLAKLRRTQPNAVRNYILESEIFIKEHKFNEALDSINAALATRQTSALLLAQRGYIHANMDKEPLAVADYIKAGSSPDLDAQAGTIVLKGLLEYDRWEEAMVVARKCMALKVVSGNLCSAASEVARHLNKLDLAEKYLTRGLNECPATLSMIHEICAVHKQMKKWDAVIKDCEKLPPLEKLGGKRISYGRCLECRAEANMNLKNYEKAVNDFTVSISMSPLKSANFKGRADAYDKLGKTALAAADRAKAKQIDNSF